jgi:hypothetical protein
MSVEIARSYLDQAQTLIAKALNELPFNPPPPPTGNVVNVNAGGNLQAALDAATAGTAISLEAGATFVGPFDLRGALGVTLTSRTTLPGPGVRCSKSAAAGFAKLRAATSGEAALRTKDGAARWTMLGIEVVGDPDANADTIQLSPSANEMMVDRCYLHGDSVRGAKRGIGLNSGKTTVINNLILDFKRSGQDTQGILGTQGPGPYLIENNHIEASGDNIMFGGSDPTTTGLIPSDIVIRRNLLKKPTIWQARLVNQWQVKNLLELKNAQRVTIENNVMEGNWLSAQVGFALLLTVRNQDGAAPWCTIRDVVVRNNIFRGSASWLSILGLDSENPSERMQNVKVLNNLAYDLDPHKWGNLATGEWGANKSIQIMGGPQDLEIGNNTVVQTNHASFLQVEGLSPKILRLNMHHNVMVEGEYGITGNNTGVGQPSWDAFTEESAFENNVIRRGTSGRNITYPGTNRVSGPDERILDDRYRLLSQFGTAGADIDALLKATGASL